MKLTRFAFVLILILSLFAVSTVGAQDEEEPRLTFTIIEDGETVSNTFEDNVNAHLYVFHASEGDRVNITMVQADTADIQFDPFFVVLNNAGRVYPLEPDDEGPRPLSDMIDDWEVPEDGTYVILATRWEAVYSIAAVMAEEPLMPYEYELSVSGINTPASLEDPDSFQYFAGQAELGGSMALEITEDEPVFFVTFVAEEGDLVTIETSDDSDGAPVDTQLYLFDPAGNGIALNDDIDDLNRYSSISNIELPEDGMYLVFATGWDFARWFVHEDGWPNAGTFLFTIE